MILINILLSIITGIIIAALLYEMAIEKDSKNEIIEFFIALYFCMMFIKIWS